MRRGVIVIGLSLLAGACVRPPTPSLGERAAVIPPPVLVAAQPSAVDVGGQPVRRIIDIDATVAAMSVEQKVGQLMMVGFGGQSVDDSVEALVRGRQVGGVCIFGRNIAGAAQVAQLNDELRALLADGIPPFIAVDQEGGNVVRVNDGNLVLPGNMLLGATRDAQLAYEAGRAQGEDLWRLGFNMNLAPVLDVNTNPANPVIGIRAFGDDVDLVASLGAEFVKGQQDANIVTVAKHFPGHGAVDADSHRALPVARASSEELRRQLRPFETAMSVGLDGMMTAHIATPALTGDELPATLSPEVLGSILRRQMKFDGLVVTDELEMDAIDRRYGVGRAAVMAVNAGADMVLIPWRSEKKLEVWEALLEAARAGTLPAERLDGAVKRVLQVKLRRGVFEALPPRDERLKALGEKRAVADRIAEEGVTLLRTDARLFPVERAKKIAVITAEGALAAALEASFPKAKTMVVPAIPAAKARNQLKLDARGFVAGADVVVVGVVNSRQLELVTNAALAGKPVIAVVMGAPYLAAQAHEARVVLAVYSYREAAAQAAARALTGEKGTPGKLPVALPRLPFGHGLNPVGGRVSSR